MTALDCENYKALATGCSLSIYVLALGAAGSALSYSGGGVQWATLHSARFPVLKRLIDVEGGDVAAQAVLDNVLQGSLQPGKPTRRVHEDPARAGCVTWLQTSRHGIAQVLVLSVAVVEVVAVVVVVVFVAVVVVAVFVFVAVVANVVVDVVFLLLLFFFFYEAWF